MYESCCYQSLLKNNSGCKGLSDFFNLFLLMICYLNFLKTFPRYTHKLVNKNNNQDYKQPSWFIYQCIIMSISYQFVKYNCMDKCNKNLMLMSINSIIVRREMVIAQVRLYGYYIEVFLYIYIFFIFIFYYISF